MNITVAADLCSGHGRCYVLSPDLFTTDDEGFCVERGSTRTVPAGLERSAQLAADSCPERAITITITE